MKQIHFLAGLPRSGNTLLSAILNQNPLFYSSPLSPLPGVLWAAENEFLNGNSYMRNPNPTALKNVMNGIVQNYYQDIEQNIIFDRQKNWTTPSNLRLITDYINPNPKIIFTVRDIVSILASYMVQAKDHSFIDNAMMLDDFYPMYYMDANDARAEYLMREKEMISHTLLGLATMLKEENKNFLHIVDYDDLLSNPNDVMIGIYNFLELEPYTHDFKNITKKENDDHNAFNEPKTLHDIRSVLGKSNIDPNKVLSEYIINKYKGSNFWREQK